MLDINLLLALIWLHFFADFILQTDRIAHNKATDSVILLEHVTIYTIPFLGFGLEFAVANMLLHFIVDFFTARVTSALWKKKDYYWFFKVIGLDQALHITCLILTAKWML